MRMGRRGTTTIWMMSSSCVGGDWLMQNMRVILSSRTCTVDKERIISAVCVSGGTTSSSFLRSDYPKLLGPLDSREVPVTFLTVNRQQACQRCCTSGRISHVSHAWHTRSGQLGVINRGLDTLDEEVLSTHAHPIVAPPSRNISRACNPLGRNTPAQCPHQDHSGSLEPVGQVYPPSTSWS